MALLLEAPTDAVFGVVGMTTYLLFVATAMLGKVIYRSLMAIAVVLMGYNGVLKHVLNFKLAALSVDLDLAVGYFGQQFWYCLALIGCSLFQSSSPQS